MVSHVDESVYREQGYDSRKDHLDHLADEYGVSQRTVYVLAEMLGPSEDFDGLVSALEDV